MAICLITPGARALQQHNIMTSVVMKAVSTFIRYTAAFIKLTPSITGPVWEKATSDHFYYM